MTIETLILDRAGRFAGHRKTVEAALAAAIEWVTARAGSLDVDISVAPTDFGRDQSLNAVAQGPHNISLGIDIACFDDAELFELVRCCAIHELHHCYRWPEIERWTVAECIVLEGLAKIADIEAYRAAQPAAPMPGWTIAVPKATEDEFQELAATDMEVARDWLYAPEPGAPRGTPSRIYSVGLAMMLRATHALRLDPWRAAKRTGDDLIKAALGSSAQPNDIWRPA